MSALVLWRALKLLLRPFRVRFPFNLHQPASKLGETDLLFGSGPRCIIRATLHRHRHRHPPNTLHSLSHMRTRIGRHGGQKRSSPSLARSLARSFVSLHRLLAGCSSLCYLHCYLWIIRISVRVRLPVRVRSLARTLACGAGNCEGRKE